MIMIYGYEKPFLSNNTLGNRVKIEYLQYNKLGNLLLDRTR